MERLIFMGACFTFLAILAIFDVGNARKELLGLLVGGAFLLVILVGIALIVCMGYMIFQGSVAAAIVAGAALIAFAILLKS